VGPLHALQLETQHIPDVLDAPPLVLDITTSKIRELHGLTENFRQMTQVLYERMQEVRRINKARLESVELEKKHLYEKEMLVKDLHDGIGGLITKIFMLAQYAKSENKFAVYDEIMDKILALAYEGGVEVRSFMNSLESDQTAWSDLLAEIAEHCERMFEPEHTNHSVSSMIAPDAPGVGVFRYVNIVRIFRESVANIVKHAHARNVLISFQVTDWRFILKITDDGGGYDSNSVRKRGVANMFSRAALMGADFSIEPAPSGGTAVLLSVPLNDLQVEIPCE
jgi:signal transduction histidine kinase